MVFIDDIRYIMMYNLKKLQIIFYTNKHVFKKICNIYTLYNLSINPGIKGEMTWQNIIWE